MGSHLREESVMREAVWALAGMALMFGMYAAFCVWLTSI